MRTNDILLDGFENIKILQQYLYMSEEHFIEVENSIGVHLQIRMRENLHYYCKNMNFPDLPDACWSDNMHPETMIAIIDQLQEQPAVEFPKRFKSRWEEIKCITYANVTQNRLKYVRTRRRDEKNSEPVN